MTDCLPRLGLLSAVALALAFAMVLGACSATPTSQPTTTGATPGPVPTATLEPPATVGPPPTATPDQGSSPLVIDATLLAYLPPDVAGIPVTESIDEATAALSSSVLQELASSIAAGVAVDTVDGNLVYALVVQLQPDALDDAAFRDWRDSYDEGACSAAGLVTGRAEAEIDGRTVYIGTCEGGFITYHVLLAEEDILISAWSLGEGRFGEQLVSNLRVEG